LGRLGAASEIRLIGEGRGASPVAPVQPHAGDPPCERDRANASIVQPGSPLWSRRWQITGPRGRTARRRRRREAAAGGAAPPASASGGRKQGGGRNRSQEQSANEHRFAPSRVISPVGARGAQAR
jgi:hypothetical protein